MVCKIVSLLSAALLITAPVIAGPSYSTKFCDNGHCAEIVTDQSTVFLYEIKGGVASEVTTAKLDGDDDNTDLIILYMMLEELIREISGKSIPLPPGE
jgi:hypothetical protein